MDYDAQKQTLANYEVAGKDPVCNAPITRPKEAGQIWLADGGMVSLSSAMCTLSGIKQFEKSGRKVQVAYLYDKALGIKLFADKAFFALDNSDPKKPVLVPFLLKKDAESHAAKANGKLVSYTEALEMAKAGG